MDEIELYQKKNPDSRSEEKGIKILEKPQSDLSKNVSGLVLGTSLLGMLIYAQGEYYVRNVETSETYFPEEIDKKMAKITFLAPLALYIASGSWLLALTYAAVNLGCYELGKLSAYISHKTGNIEETIEDKIINEEGIEKKIKTKTIRLKGMDTALSYDFIEE